MLQFIQADISGLISHSKWRHISYTFLHLEAGAKISNMFHFAIKKLLKNSEIQITKVIYQGRICPKKPWKAEDEFAET